MRQICCLHAANSCSDTGWAKANEPRQINVLLTEDDILFLQDIFLANGLHHIKVANMVAGREIIYKLLQSMHYYHDVTCLTGNEKIPLNKKVCNLYQAIKKYCGLNATYQDIEEYFLEQCYTDFMWVESSDELWENTIVAYAFQAMHELDIAHHIPIINVSYNS